MTLEILALSLILSALLCALGIPWKYVGGIWFCIIMLVVIGVIIGIGVQISLIWFPLIKIS